MVLLSLQVEQLSDLWLVETNYDLSVYVDHRHSTLTAAADHIARCSLITGYIDIAKRDSILPEKTLCHVAVRAGWGAEYDHAWWFGMG